MTAPLSIVEKPPKPTIRTEDKVMVTTIIPELAAEIGLNESIMLRQIVFWINSTDNLRDGQWWTYQTLKGMQQDAFPYWSIATISRVAAKLEDAGYIERTNRYNKRRNDMTFWYALNIEKLAQLKSIMVVLQNEKGIVTKVITPLQDEKSILQIEKPIVLDDFQNETTLPEDSTEVTTEQAPTVVSPSVVVAPEKEPPIDPDFGKVCVAMQELGDISGNLRYEIKTWLKEYSVGEILKAVDIARKNRDNGVKIRATIHSYVTGILSNQRREVEEQKQAEQSRPALKPLVVEPPQPEAERLKAIAALAEGRKYLKPTGRGLEYHPDTKAAGE